MGDTYTEVMPKKGGKKKNGKKKEFDTSPITMMPFGCQAGHFIRTPLGTEAKVLGVEKGTGFLWVEFAGGIQGPLTLGAKVMTNETEMGVYGYVPKTPDRMIQEDIKKREAKLFHDMFNAAPVAAVEALAEDAGAEAKPKKKAEKKEREL